MMTNWEGMRVLIMGAARQGLALARFLARNKAVVTLSDKNSSSQLAGAIQALSDLPVRWALGGHPLDLLDECDLLCLSGGIPLDLPIVVEALRRQVRLTNDSQIFMEAVPCRVIGITGSAGKTTTTTLVGRMAQAAAQPPQRVWVGGNIGLPLIDSLEQIHPQDLVVLELSSFQLELMTRSPQVAVVLNITPNHLDRHGTMEAYTAAKAHILTHQVETDFAVLGRDDPGAWGLASQVRGHLISFGFEKPAPGQAGACLQMNQVVFQDGSRSINLLPVTEIALRGAHNLENVLAACAAGCAAGFPGDAIRSGVAGFTGVAHRLELVRRLDGVAWYNDSIATAPERSMAAIRAFDEPLVLLLGGRDKDLPWQDLAGLVRLRVDHLVVFGEAADKIIQAIGPLQPGQRPFTLERCAGLAQAIQVASRVAESGDVVLLSPGGTSFDEFKDFEDRAEHYKKWVNQL